MDSPNNALLAALPRSDYETILPDLTQVDLSFEQVLYEPGSHMRFVYFPTGCLVSLLTLVEGHLALEVGLVGREGMVGSPLALDVSVSPVRALVQGGGTALQMTSVRFSSALHDSPTLLHGIHHYIHSLMGQIAQTAACNRFHVVEARLARWLLMTRDRVGSGEFRMTHEFLSTMLGVRREGVTVAASSFQKANLLKYSRGHISILDHAGLEAAACSCYRLASRGPEAVPLWRPGGRKPQLHRAATPRKKP